MENGCEVIVSSSNPSRVEKTVAQLQKAYPSASSRISGYACNLGDQKTIEDNIVQLFEKAGKRDQVKSGRLDDIRRLLHSGSGNGTSGGVAK